MRLGIIAFAFGCWLCQQQAQLISIDWLWVVLPALILCFLPWIYPRLVAALVLGFLWANAYGHYMAHAPFPAEWEQKNVVVSGAIASLPASHDRGASFLFQVDELMLDGRPRSWQGKIRLNWYQNKKFGVPTLRAGDRWQLVVRLKLPHGMANPGGFDAEAWMFAQGIKATGYVRAKDGVRNLSEVDGRFWLHRMRQSLRENLNTQLPVSETNGLLLALAMGDRSEIKDKQWQVLMATGTNHLMAISGLHIGLLAGLAFLLVRYFWAMIPVLCLRLPAPKAAAYAAMVAASLYALLAGFAVPTQRAWVMTMVVMWALCFFRPLALSQILCLALFAVLLWDPLAMISAGFWLSFFAVALIAYVLGHRYQSYRWWQQWGRMQWALGLALIPLTLLFFQQASIIAPLVNLVAVPWVGWLVVPPLLVASGLSYLLPELSAWILLFVSNAMEWLWQLLQWSATWQGGVWRHSVLYSWVLLSALLGMLLLLAPRGWPGRYLGVVFLSPLLWAQVDKLQSGEMDFYLLDVGQGLAAVIRTQQHVLVFDTGARYSADFDMGRAVIDPYLRSQGVEKVDLLLVSHGDNDHIGGANFLLQNWPVGQVLSSVPQQLPEAKPCVAGQHWQWDGIDFRVIHPQSGQALRKENDQSCVLRVSSAGGSVLLTGDIERQAEQQLLLYQPSQLKSDILLAPHHGSKTSSTEAFIRAVAADYVLYAVGYRNHYGHPAKSVITRYQSAEGRGLRSDHSGGIGFRLSPQRELRPELYRQLHRRYWHWQ